MRDSSPLEATRELLRAVVAQYKLRRCTSLGRDARVCGTVWIHGEGEIRIGDRVVFDAANAPIELNAWRGATIVIGDDSIIRGGTSIESTRSIVLGARVRLGSFCKVMDNQFHPLVGDRHERPVARPVVIGDDVILGPRSIVLAGARIAGGTRAGAGTVIKRSAPARVLGLLAEDGS